MTSLEAKLQYGNKLLSQHTWKIFCPSLVHPVYYGSEGSVGCRSCAKSLARSIY